MGSKKSAKEIIGELAPSLFSLPWLDLVVEIWKLARKLWKNMADEGMYEVLDYKCTLELLDKRGQRAAIRKRERVRYLQNNIIAYQDQAWGDGKILVDYQCSPGVVVDKYRPGDKTYILISLREIRKRGDIDDFHINWEQQKGFLRDKEQWSNEIRHRTKLFRIEVIFPNTRPPLQVWLAEYLRKRTRLLGQESKRQLPDGRWLVSWETEHPRFHEEYTLKWQW